MNREFKSAKPADFEKLSLHEISSFVTDRISAMLAYWDNNQVCRFANSAYREWFGKTPAEMIGKITMKELLGPLYEKNLPYILGALKGAKQVFERKIPLPEGGSRHTIATYYPNIIDGQVKGFFVHVADITPVKLLEEKLRQMESSKKREVLRSIIETREKERETLANNLRDNISQTLAYCKMMLQSESSKEPNNTFFNQIANYIHLAIHQLNTLSNDLSPSFIAHFGFKHGLEDYTANFQKQHNRIILLTCDNDKIEELSIADKISVFRIVQDYLLLVVTNPASRKISITIRYDHSCLSLCFSHDDLSFELPRQSREFNDIQNRIEYYGGFLAENKKDGESVLEISFDIR